MVKRLSLVLVVTIMCAFSLNAQNYRECVYLKNGSVIKGVIVEQLLGKSLTIETADGSRLVYEYCDIVKITKEEVEIPRSYRPKTNRERNNSRKPMDKQQVEPIVGNRVSTLQAGYRGFLEVNGGYNWWQDNVGYSLGAMTSHGYQFSPFFYMGVGAGVDMYSMSVPNIPVFAHLRTTFFNRKVTPWIDIKGGYSFGNLEGLYFDPSVGLRFSIGKRSGLNIGVGYTMQQTYNTQYAAKHSDEASVYDKLGSLALPKIKIGFDF